MKDFPIDDRNEIGKKKQKVSRKTMYNLAEFKLKEIIRKELKIMNEADLEKGSQALPSKLKIYMGRFTDEVNKAKLNKVKKIAILFKTIKALGLNPQEVQMYITKVKKEI